RMLRVWTVREEGTPVIEIAAFETRRELIGKRLALANVDHSKTAEIAILRAERAVDDGDILDQLGAERLQRPEITLAVALRALILLYMIQQHLKAAVDAAVVKIKAETANLQRLAAAFMLPGVDAGIQLLQNLIVPREERPVEHFGVAKINGGLDGFRGDDDA